jgi:hypothetical protein
VTVVSQSGIGFSEAFCPAGTTPTGANLSGGALEESMPQIGGSKPNGAWVVDAVTGTDEVIARVICASP